jgi:hypothetical protein
MRAKLVQCRVEMVKCKAKTCTRSDEFKTEICAIEEFIPVYNFRPEREQLR